MKLFNPKSQLVIALLSLSLLACSKKEESAGKAAAPSPSESAEVKSAKAPDEAPTPDKTPEKVVPNQEADYVRLLATHKDPQATDPVVIDIKNFKVTQASFDPSNLEGASAEITLDLLSLDSGIEKRNTHLKSADYLDTDKTPQVVIKIRDVKKTSDTFQAIAEVSAHSVTKTMPVVFKVIKSSADSVQIEASKEFDRNDFAISTGDSDMSAPSLKIEMRLTLHKG